MRLIGNVARIFVPDQATDQISRQIACRLPDKLVRSPGTPDFWERRILELSDGRTVGEIVGVLYSDELRAGASITDIGMWKQLFDKRVVNCIFDLAQKGYIRLELSEADKEGGYAQQPQ